MNKLLVLIAVAAGMALSLSATIETVTSETKTFRIWTEDSYVLLSEADFSAWPVTWSEGDTVVAEAAGGTTTTFVDGAVSASSRELECKGGVWLLENSIEGAARVFVPWSVFGDGGDIAKSSGTGLRLDTYLVGPDRRVQSGIVPPPVAYSGDDWSGDILKAASLTFTAPSGAVKTVEPNAGDGVHSFTFDEIGEWTVVLTFADDKITSRTAKIKITTSGFTISLR